MSRLENFTYVSINCGIVPAAVAGVPGQLASDSGPLTAPSGTNAFEISDLVPCAGKKGGGTVPDLHSGALTVKDDTGATISPDAKGRYQLGASVAPKINANFFNDGAAPSVEGDVSATLRVFWINAA
jgi:hypothetical protein